MQKNLVKLSYLAQKVLQRGQVPVLQLVDLPSMLTQNNGRKMPIFVTPCILSSHTGFKNIFSLGSINQQFFDIVGIQNSAVYHDIFDCPYGNGYCLAICVHNLVSNESLAYVHFIFMLQALVTLIVNKQKDIQVTFKPIYLCNFNGSNCIHTFQSI